MGLAQGSDHRLVDEHGDGGVQGVLAQVEGQEYWHQQVGHGGSGHSHVDGGDQVVPQQHERGGGQSAHHQTGGSALEGVTLLVDEGGGAGEAAGGQDVHNAADGAGGADGDHLDEGNHGGDLEGGQGPEDEAAHGDDDVLGIVAQEALDGGMRK